MNEGLFSGDVSAILGITAQRLGILVDMGACPCWQADSPDGVRVWLESSLPTWREILAATGQTERAEGPIHIGVILPDVLRSITRMSPLRVGLGSDDHDAT